ncbi:MAG: phosphotransferase [Actinobacteria bacterium]|nr:phosphotransferase [Actinomycetota bacterium]
MDSELERLDAIARGFLVHYGIAPSEELTLLNISENATFLVRDPRRDDPTILRLHRMNYHSREAIESELAWVEALSEANVVRTPTVIPAADGRRVVDGAQPDGESRHAVMFEFLPGIEPPGDRLVDSFRTLGAIAARMHVHARSWKRPAGFTRFTWDFESTLGPQGRWGNWHDGMGVGRQEQQVLGRAADLMSRRLANYGSDSTRFGLVHADMRLANLLLDGDCVSVIDFDDSGFSWYMYDLGSALSFIEDHPQVPEMIASWTNGYREVTSLAAEDEAELETFVMLRRLLLVAWIGSHSMTETAQQMGTPYTTVSCELAETYLSRHS